MFLYMHSPPLRMATTTAKLVVGSKVTRRVKDPTQSSQGAKDVSQFK